MDSLIELSLNLATLMISGGLNANFHSSIAVFFLNNPCFTRGSLLGGQGSVLYRVIAKSADLGLKPDLLCDLEQVI